MAKKTKKAAQEPQETSILDFFSGKVGAQTAAPGGEADVKKGPSVEDLQKQLASLQNDLAESKRSQIAMMAQAPVAAAAPDVGKPPEMSYENLPDPLVEPEKYHKELTKRVSEFTRETMAWERKAEQAQAQVQQGQQGQYDALWDAFAASHEDYAEDPTKVEFVTTKVIADLRSRGVDPVKYMQVGRDAFFGDVIKKYDETFGKPGDEDEGGKAEDDEPAERTAGMFGGQESGNKPAAPAGKPGDMIRDLQDLQRSSGFF